MARKDNFNLGQLCTAIQKARQTLRYYREQRREMVRQYAGAHWSEEGTDKTVPVNMLALYANIVGRALIAKNPRVMLSTFDRQAKPMVSAMQDWCNLEIQKTHLAETLQRVVLDALFSIGICKVALATPADAASFSWRLRAGAPFAERVDLDDFVFDVHARSFEEVGYIGHRYRVPLDTVRDSKLYSKARKDLTATEDNPYNLEGDERIGVLGRGYYSTMEEYEDFVDLWEIYLPRRRLVLTLADNQLSVSGPGSDGEPLREQGWIGPDAGPYHILGLGTVPGNAMAKGPLQDLVDLHDAGNRIFRKLIRQAERQKTNTFVQGGAMEDGSRVQQSNDGEIVRVDNPQNIKEVPQGGPNQLNIAFFQSVWDLFNKMGGNLEMMGGLAPQSKTATQDKLLASNASGQLQDMQEVTIKYTASVLSGLCWYWWKDPFHVASSQHSIPGLPDMGITRKVTPGQRQQVPFEELQINVDPYSLQHQTPQARLQGIMEVVKGMYLPIAQLAQAQGVTLDLSALFRKIGEYMDLPDLADLITVQEPPPAEAQGGGGGGGTGATMPPETTRNYVRRSLGGDTPENRTATMLNSLHSNGQQNKNGQPQGAA